VLPVEDSDRSVKRRVAVRQNVVVAGQHPSIADIPESVLVEQVVGSRRTRGHVLDCRGFPSKPVDHLSW
jgi:hypothetical protein